MPTPASSSCLLIDAASPVVQTGLVCAGAWQAFHRSDRPALSALFQGVQTCLAQAQMDLTCLDGLIYCQGPGSTLGLRIAAMAIEGWRSLPGLRALPLYTYSSLSAAAALLLNQGIVPPWRILAAYRPGQWHCITVSEAGVPGRATVIAGEALEQKTLPCYGLHLGKRPASFPASVQPLEYDLRDLPAILESVCTFEPQKQALPASSSSESYVRWQGQRHR